MVWIVNLYENWYPVGFISLLKILIKFSSCQVDCVISISHILNEKLFCLFPENMKINAKMATPIEEKTDQNLKVSFCVFNEENMIFLKAVNE